MGEQLVCSLSLSLQKLAAEKNTGEKHFTQEFHFKENLKQTLPPDILLLKNPLGKSHVGDHPSLIKVTNSRFSFSIGVNGGSCLFS